MDWRQEYARKRVDAEEAVRVVRSHDRVVTSHACGHPERLVEALCARGEELEDVEILHLVGLGKSDYCRPELAGSFFHNSFFVGAQTREAVQAGRADYTPAFFHEVPRFFRDGSLPVDVALIHVSPPDKHGCCSLGISVDYTRAAADTARTVIAQVNPRMPRTWGETAVPLAQIDYVVECEDELLEVRPVQIGPVEEAIGRQVAALVEDGSSLQLGIGGVPDAVLQFLGDKHDLGIHTEMFSDCAVDLIEQGVVTNRRKALHRGRTVANFLMGTRRLYDFVDDNPLVNMFPVDHVNDPCVIGQIDQVVSINSALQVDLMGQVVADTMGPLQFTGIGGQVDFVRGAARSRGGKSIIALPSTAKGGTISRIVAVVSEGSAITTSRADVDYIVTEHGVAALKGKKMRDRAEALIAIAHPQFQDQLIEEVGRLRGEHWLRGSVWATL